MKNKIKILTGPIQSGKTTRLFSFVNQHKNAEGILSPIVNDRRVLYDISKKSINTFEVIQSNEEIISIGKYKFLQSSFDWGNQIVLDGLKKKAEWLIIDEIGKLELEGEGFHKSLIHVLKEIEFADSKLILVIRDYLINDVINYYEIDKLGYEILEI